MEEQDIIQTRAELFWFSQKRGASAPGLLDLPLPFPTGETRRRSEAPPPPVEHHSFILFGVCTACRRCPKWTRIVTMLRSREDGEGLWPLFTGEQSTSRWLVGHSRKHTQRKLPELGLVR